VVVAGGEVVSGGRDVLLTLKAKVKFLNSVDKDQFDASALELALSQTIAESLYGRHRHDNAAIIALRYLADVENVYGIR
jgi:hypothetical protein